MMSSFAGGIGEERRYAARGASDTAKSLHIGPPALIVCEASGQLGPRADAEFAVDPGEVRLDGADGDEQGRGDLLVLAASRGEHGNATLAFGELSGRRSTTADSSQFVACLRFPRTRADLVKDRQRAAQRFTRRTSLESVALHGAEGEEHTRPLEWIRGGIVRGNRLREVREGGCDVAARLGEQS